MADEGLSLKAVLDAIVEREGGYVNHPKDKGGPTNYGVTQRALSNYRGKKATIQDVKNLTPREAKMIYWNDYIKPFRFVQDQRLLDLIADSSVHHGPQRTARWLQQALGVQPDGRPEAQTIEAYKNSDPAALYESVLKTREEFLTKLGQAPSQRQFAEGWQKRLGEFKDDGTGNNRGNP